MYVRVCVYIYTESMKPSAMFQTPMVVNVTDSKIFRSVPFNLNPNRAPAVPEKVNSSRRSDLVLHL